MGCQSIGLTHSRFSRSVRELWSEHWPDSVVYISGFNVPESVLERPRRYLGGDSLIILSNYRLSLSEHWPDPFSERTRNVALAWQIILIVNGVVKYMWVQIENTLSQGIDKNKN
eukprot:sb/3476831/